MEEDTELEEGEAKEPCDPDTDFSYLDKKLQLLLGDQQKEFQGCTISTEKLGRHIYSYIPPCLMKAKSHHPFLLPFSLMKCSIA
jgi:hypothetical protein